MNMGCNSYNSFYNPLDLLLLSHITIKIFAVEFSTDEHKLSTENPKNVVFAKLSLFRSIHLLVCP